MTTSRPNTRQKSYLTGAILLIIGTALLLRHLSVDIPHWLISWKMILVVVGLAIAVHSRFRSPAAYILILLGGLLVLDEALDLHFRPMQFFWPILFIAAGLIVILQALQKRPAKVKAPPSGDDTPPRETSTATSDHEVLDLTSIFNGIKRTVLSQNFAGGESITLFGGTELNLLQSDLAAPRVTLECVVILGGLKIIVPKDWEVRIDATSILGGVNDKRLTAREPQNGPAKILTIDGTVLLGGIEVISY